MTEDQPLDNFLIGDPNAQLQRIEDKLDTQTRMLEVLELILMELQYLRQDMSERSQYPRQMRVESTPRY